ncbi:ribonuclease III [Candidatus Microgenomates bacterium]|nr:ribonuclease III [Candidatus Microgenomates bacterium]
MNEDKLQKKLGIEFKDPKLLHKSLVHRSYLNESNEPESNERLEFLGDAILEFIVSKELFINFPNLAEGELTSLRANLVNTESLAKASGEIGLGMALYMSRGEEKGGGRESTSLLANSFEALIGALFLDQGVGTTQDLIEKFILVKTQDALKNLKDAKSLLQEKVQAAGNKAPVYKIIEESGPDHAKTFVVGSFIGEKELSRGTGRSKQEAEQLAASAALENFE